MHWKPEEAEDHTVRLERAGFQVLLNSTVVPNLLRILEDKKPEAVLIDLSRAPSQGRDLAIALRKRKGTRHIPLVFVDGQAQKVEKIRKLLPDAGYTDWPHVAETIKAAVRKGVEDPVVPESVFAAYSGKPLAEKLGIKRSFVVSLVGAAEDFEAVLGKLPDGAVLACGTNPEADLTIWFVRTEAELRRDLASITAAAKRAPAWIAWPKRGSAISCDLTQQRVREAGLAQGMVDYKICAIDKDWSALLFTWRGKP